MPVYVYEIITESGQPGPRFEYTQRMSDPPLKRHPDSGQPVRRVILSPNLGLKHSEGSIQNKLDNRNIEKAGFTKYEKDKLTGQYHRVAGKQGPETIHRPTAG